LIPQDYDGGPNPASLARLAIGQDQLQAWLASVKAKKAIVFLDTCESGALIGGHSHSRFTDQATEAAVGRLHEATGRPVLTAAAAGQFAYEVRGARHALFTGAVLALRNADTNSEGLITISALVAYVQDRVPKLAAQVGSKFRSFTAVSNRVEVNQTPRFGSRGEDFPLVRRLQ
jgi:hypothetical protein